MLSPLIICGSYFNLLLKYILGEYNLNDVRRSILNNIYELLFPVVSCDKNHTLLKIDNEIYACGSNFNNRFKLKNVDTSIFQKTGFDSKYIMHTENSFYVVDISFICQAGVCLTKSEQNNANDLLGYRKQPFTQHGCFVVNNMKVIDRINRCFNWYNLKLDNQFKISDIKNIIITRKSCLILNHSKEIYIKNFINNFAEKIDLPLVKTIASNGTNYIVVTIFGDLYAWGGNLFGELGLGHTDFMHFPQKIDVIY